MYSVLQRGIISRCQLQTAEDISAHDQILKRSLNQGLAFVKRGLGAYRCDPGSGGIRSRTNRPYAYAEVREREYIIIYGLNGLHLPLAVRYFHLARCGSCHYCLSLLSLISFLESSHGRRRVLEPDASRSSSPSRSL